jgi:hypothetical protein
MDDIKKPKKEINNTQLEVNLRESVFGPRKSASSPRESAIVEWQAPAFKYYPKDVSWYWLSLIIAIILVAFAVWQKNFLFAVFVFLAEIMIFTWAGRRPELIKFKIDDKGISLAGKIYNYSDLEKFCLRPDKDEIPRESASTVYEELILKRKTHLNPYFKILVEAKISSQVREILSQKLTEEEYEDSLLEGIFKWLRF